MKLLQIPALGLILLAVSACNETSQPQAVATTQLPCHCTQAAQPAEPAAPAEQTAAAAPAPVAHRWHHHYRHWAWSHETASSSYSVEESESRSVDRVYQSDETQTGAEVETGYSVWIDGYGRKHCYYTGHRDHDHDHDRDAGWQRVNDDRSRLDPWNGYDGNDGPENGY